VWRGCRLALKSACAGLVSQEQCEGLVLGWSNSRVSYFSLEKGPSFRVCSSGFCDLLREKPFPLFMLLGWGYCKP
jgi:hypothetical protein